MALAYANGHVVAGLEHGIVNVYTRSSNGIILFHSSAVDNYSRKNTGMSQVGAPLKARKAQSLKYPEGLF